MVEFTEPVIPLLGTPSIFGIVGPGPRKDFSFSKLTSLILRPWPWEILPPACTAAAAAAKPALLLEFRLLVGELGAELGFECPVVP